MDVFIEVKSHKSIGIGKCEVCEEYKPLEIVTIGTNRFESNGYPFNICFSNSCLDFAENKYIEMCI